MTPLSVELKPREGFGKGSAKKLRKEGEVPCAISSIKLGAIHASVDQKTLGKLVLSSRFFATVIEAEIVAEGKKQKIKIIPSNVDFHPVKDTPIHVDFIHITEDAVTAQVPVKVVGADKAPGLKKGGKLNLVRYHVPLKCKTNNIPEVVEVNISTFGVGRSIFLSAVALPKDVQAAYDCLILSITGRGRKDKEEVASAETKTETK